MPARTRVVLLLLCMALLGVARGDSEPESRDNLLDALRKGGFTIYFRHAQTDWSQTDTVRGADDVSSCDESRVRQLSGEGRMTAARIGQSIRALAIPVGRVLASPYCRAMETARLMDVGEVEATEHLMNLRVADLFGGRDAVVANARDLLAMVPAAGSNTLLVAHGNLARNATSVYPGEAEGVVFRPDGRGGFELFARIGVSDWSTLAGLPAN